MTQKRLRKPIMSNTNRLSNSKDDDDDDDEEKHWYHHMNSSSSPQVTSLSSSHSIHHNFHHQLSAATMGSWGFDVNRSANGQTPLSFTSNNSSSNQYQHHHPHNNNNNNNNKNHDEHIIVRVMKDYNDHPIDASSSSSASAHNSKIRTPTLTKQRSGNEFDAIDRLALGPNRNLRSKYYPVEDFSQQKMISANPPLWNSTNQQKMQAEQELMAWQKRRIQREHRPIVHQSQESIKPMIRLDHSEPSNPAIPSSVRPMSATSNTSESPPLEHDHQEATIKVARVTKRYIELLYHLQSYYERITDQLFNGNTLRNIQSSQTIFGNHCRQITEQLQKFKPTWEDKLAFLQSFLKDISSFEWSKIKSETTFLQRRSTLINLLQTLNTQKEFNDTDQSIRADVDRLLHDDKLALQLQDELATLLQHQSLLNDLTSLLQWNHKIYSPNEQIRVENVLPLLRDQLTTTDGYISHVSQQLTDLVTNARSLEKYILSYTNTIPSIEDGIVAAQSVSSNRSRRRPYDENDFDTMKIKESRSRESNRNGHGNDKTPKTRSFSTSRVIDSEEMNHHFDRDDRRVSINKGNILTNTNGSDNNIGSTARLATVKSAKRDVKTQPNSILKPYPPPITSPYERKPDYDMHSDAFKPNRVNINDRLNDVDSDDPLLTMNDRIVYAKRREDSRKPLPKQNIQIANDQVSNSDYIQPTFDYREYAQHHERVTSSQSTGSEEVPEKNQQIAAKRYFYKPY